MTHATEIDAATRAHAARRDLEKCLFRHAARIELGMGTPPASGLPDLCRELATAANPLGQSDADLVDEARRRLTAYGTAQAAALAAIAEVIDTFADDIGDPRSPDAGPDRELRDSSLNSGGASAPPAFSRDAGWYEPDDLRFAMDPTIPEPRHPRRALNTPPRPDWAEDPHQPAADPHQNPGASLLIFPLVIVVLTAALAFAGGFATATAIVG